ncbi:MAG: hypothetical protein R3C12_07890 [Planctomycetaceae bacterium]
MDSTEQARRELVQEVNQDTERAKLEEKYGELMTTSDMQSLYDVEGFLSPFVVCRRKSDGKRGTLMFSHSPRFYFGWQED